MGNVVNSLLDHFHMFQQLNEEFYKILGVKHQVTAAYHPQTNGLDERTNQNIKRWASFEFDFLIKFVEQFFLIISISQCCTAVQWTVPIVDTLDCSYIGWCLRPKWKTSVASNNTLVSAKWFWSEKFRQNAIMFHKVVYQIDELSNVPLETFKEREEIKWSLSNAQWTKRQLCRKKIQEDIGTQIQMSLL